jgi:hypothetical protein
MDTSFYGVTREFPCFGYCGTAGGRHDAFSGHALDDQLFQRMLSFLQRK